jgi:hypothetical protein
MANQGIPNLPFFPLKSYLCPAIGTDPGSFSGTWQIRNHLLTVPDNQATEKQLHAKCRLCLIETPYPLIIHIFPRLPLP